jgi:hypothetical protein
MVHLLPFQRSVSGRTGPSCDKVVLYAPAARQFVADVHEMPSRPLPWAPAGVGMGCMAHRVPFHPSARFPEAESPTAMQADGELHDTALRAAPGRVGTGWMRHAVPFHRSAIVTKSPELVR